ncbi:MAG: hypothetical protein Q8N56_01260 [bacterium]|nr:hypothetical protein [bacterium]
MPQDWFSVTVGALQNLWLGFLYFIPNLIGALIVFLVGWFVSSWIGWIVAKVLNLVKLNQLFAKGQWDEALDKAGIKADVANFLGQICRWILVFAFMSAAVEILGLVQFAALFSQIVAWLPNIIVVVLIMIVAVVVADILEKIAIAAVIKAKIKSTHAIALVVRWSVYVFSLMAILLQLNIASPLIQTLFTGLIAILVIAGGLAFGLGGKDLAKQVLEDIYQRVKNS